MNRKTLVAALVGALAAGGMVGGTTVAFAQADVIKQRQENRKATAGEMRAIKAVIDSKGDAKTVVASAAKLKQLENAFDKLFPAGSDKGETKALPTVWSDSAGFQAASKAADAAYDKLAVAAGSGDLAAVTAAFGDTGKACGACHEKFRAKAN
ncbi:MAG: cytochrome c [Reyranella sp.]|uniref:c-type cytochrome n=1 Tax=Reyranella sp. TaxID=1929291 RepID=UPI001AC582B1|nr:cytochrome c [Reyranella sp.]MBN9091486.1 cytochrome c [Reyranella sp.]